MIKSCINLILVLHSYGEIVVWQEMCVLNVVNVIDFYRTENVFSMLAGL